MITPMVNANGIVTLENLKVSFPGQGAVCALGGDSLRLVLKIVTFYGFYHLSLNTVQSAQFVQKVRIATNTNNNNYS